MRYLELLEYEDAANAVVPPAQVEPEAEAAPVVEATRLYYHVTTKHRLRSIEATGIEPNRKRRWKTGFGQQLGDRGKIYLMSDFTAAVRWAFKMQWEHYRGKTPEKSPYIIICVRENPDKVEPDPHPENGLYGHSWFQKSGRIAPKNILRVIPLTDTLIRQVTDGGTAVMERFMSLYDPARCLRALRDQGWTETTTPGMFQNSEYPEYSIDLDINNPQGGPFTVFRGDRKLAVVRKPPTAQSLGLKDRLI